MTYKEAVKYILDIPKFGANINGRHKTGKDNLLQVMEILGNPQRNKNAIHIAGTNGKGSTLQFTKNILCAHGYNVGYFVSPHLVKINERIGISRCISKDNCVIEDSNIKDEQFLECFKKVKEAVEHSISLGCMHLSFFEFLFAMAAVFFDNSEVDYVIYETGLGGRLDATNIISPMITAITSIGLDHTKYLGDTIKDIAAEKAGIIKLNVPVVYNTGEHEADYIIEKTAKSYFAKAVNVGKLEYIINDYKDKTIDFSFESSYYKYDNLKLQVGSALYQVDNAVTAISICEELLGINNINSDMLKKGLLMFKWAGRMEYFNDNVILDGAHNIDAIERFIECLKFGYPDKKIKLLFAVSGDKDYEQMIDMLCYNLDLSEVYVTSLNSERGISAEYIAAIFRHSLSKKGESSIRIVSDDDINKIYHMGYESAKRTNDILFCVGSLYLIGSIKGL